MKESTSNKIHSYYNEGFKTHRYNNYINLLAICFLLFTFSCKARKQLVVKQATVDSAVKPVDTKKDRLDAIRAGQTTFNTFSGKARTVLNINGSSNDVTLNIRIKRDQKIWVSITAIAGIEAARVLITPDSIMIINRLQNIYVKQPFSYINSVAGNQVNYKTIESLLIGNAIPELLNENADVKTSADSTVSSSEQSSTMMISNGRSGSAFKTSRSTTTRTP